MGTGVPLYGISQIDQMRSAPAEDYVQAMNNFMASPWGPMAFIYKDIKSLPSSVYEAIQAGAQHDFVNLMIGTNQNETTSFLIGRNATSPVGCCLLADFFLLTSFLPFFYLDRSFLLRDFSEQCLWGSGDHRSLNGLGGLGGLRGAQHGSDVRQFRLWSRAGERKEWRWEHVLVHVRPPGRSSAGCVSRV